MIDWNIAQIVKKRKIFQFSTEKTWVWTWFWQANCSSISKGWPGPQPATKPIIAVKTIRNINVFMVTLPQKNRVSKIINLIFRIVSGIFPIVHYFRVMNKLLQFLQVNVIIQQGLLCIAGIYRQAVLQFAISDCVVSYKGSNHQDLRTKTSTCSYRIQIFPSRQNQYLWLLSYRRIWTPHSSRRRLEP